MLSIKRGVFLDFLRKRGESQLSEYSDGLRRGGGITRPTKYNTARMFAAGGLYAGWGSAYSPPAADILTVSYLLRRMMPPPLRNPSEYSDNCSVLGWRGKCGAVGDLYSDIINIKNWLGIFFGGVIIEQIGRAGMG